MNKNQIKRAFLSVYDKSGLIAFAQQLQDLQIEIIASGGTSSALAAANIDHRRVEDITGFPAMLGGRVKTMHPKIHGGILANRQEHSEEIQKYALDLIDLVVVNFYPFAEVIKKPHASFAEAIEQIDIGGPALVRAAAKNCAYVTVIVEPHDYDLVIAALREQGMIDFSTRQLLAEKAFRLTSQYDATIQHYFASQTSSHSEPPLQMNLVLDKKQELRYGENPHQRAFIYQFKQNTGFFAGQSLQGKPLSYNNILDAQSAWDCVNELTDTACVIVKHGNPCGAAQACDIETAYQYALASDPVSAFGGIIAFNRICTEKVASEIIKMFAEVVLAPAFTPESLALFTTRPNLRLLQMSQPSDETWEMKFVSGGLLLQEKNRHQVNEADLKVVTSRKPSPEDIEAMLFAWRVLKHLKSNAILIAQDHRSVGIGAGLVSRVDAVDMAVRKAGEKIRGAVLASDAFFPFRDSIDRLADTGIQAIIQPGGSVRDEEVIAACNEHQIAMVFTGTRCFKH